jgi:hypothetical protein
MKTKKSKKNIKVRDLKPSKDAKGGRFVLQGSTAVAGAGKVPQGSSLTSNPSAN